jgi:ABC-type microcin C transport system duplicated ATPase subunit YejF
MRSLDPELHRRLSQIIATGRRSVKAVARANILPKETIFFDHPTSTTLGRNGRVQRLEQRDVWLNKALRSTSDFVSIPLSGSKNTRSQTTTME